MPELHGNFMIQLPRIYDIAEPFLKKKNCAENIPEAVQLLGKSLSDVRLISYNLSPADITKKGFKGKSCKPLRFYGTDLRCKIQNLNA